VVVTARRLDRLLDLEARIRTRRGGDGRRAGGAVSSAH